MLTCLRTGKYDQIMRWWSSKTHSGIAKVLYSAAYCCLILPFLSWYYIPHLRYHTRSFSHPVTSLTRPSIFAYRKRSSSHLGVSHLHISIPSSRSNSLPPPRAYCMDLSPLCLLIFASCDISAKVALNCFSVASCPPPRSHYHLSTLQIPVTTPPTMIRLHVVSLCKSYPPQGPRLIPRLQPG